jgi:hypothetical protein
LGAFQGGHRVQKGTNDPLILLVFAPVIIVWKSIFSASAPCICNVVLGKKHNGQKIQILMIWRVCPQGKGEREV